MEALFSWLSCLAFAAIILALLLRYLQRRDTILAWVLLGYFGVCLAFIVIRWSFHLDLAVYDVEKYQTWSAHIAALLRADFLGNLPHIWQPFAAYTLPLGLLYTVFGISEPLGQLLNTVVGLGVIFNLHRLATLWFNRRVADHTALFMALYPYGWVLGGTLNRDMMVAFCLTLLFRSLTELQNQEGHGSRLWPSAAALGSLLYMTLLRPPLFILGALTIFVFWVVHPLASSRRLPLFRTLRLISICLVLFLGTVGFFTIGKFYTARNALEQEVTRFSDVDHMTERLRNSEQAGSAYLRGVTYTSYLDVAKLMPVATCYFLFSPFPWQVSSPKQALGVLDSAWLILVFLYFLRGIRPLFRRYRKVAWALTAFLVVGLTTSSVLQANVGSAMRHRTMFTFLMFPVAVQGMMMRRASRSRLSQGIRVPEARRPPAGGCQ
jgi:hypothetical protein